MSLSKEQRAFTLDIANLIIYAYGLGIELTMGDAYRSSSQMLLNYFGKQVVRDGQELLIKDAKKVSWTLSSNHAKRLAVDFNFFIDGNLTYTDDRLKILGAYWVSLNPDKNRWGGDFKNIDTPHFERSL